MSAHIEWIKQHSDTILVAGSLRSEPDAVPKGGLWMVDAISKAAVMNLVESDPFFVSGLRASVEVLHWSKALPDQMRLV